MKTDILFNKRHIISIIAVAVLHGLVSLAISDYHGNLAGRDVGVTISKAIDKSDLTDKNIQDMNVRFEEEVRPTYYLAFALSLPFGPIFRPLHKEWITEPLLNHEIGQNKFKQRAKIIGGAELVSNGVFWGFFIVYIWKLIWKLAIKRLRKNTT